MIRMTTKYPPQRLLLWLVCSSVLLTTAAARRDVMVWLCLDICGQGGENATKNLNELGRHLDVVSAISFEKYTLGPDSTLVTFDITEVRGEGEREWGYWY